MKTKLWNVCTLGFLAGMVLLVRPATMLAAEGDNMDRLGRLEQRVNQIAERQEQLMNRLAAQMDGQPQPGRPDAQNPRPQFRPQPGQQMAPGLVPLPAQPNPDRARMAKSIHDFIGLILFVGMICNILLAIWIFTDIRKRGEGSGIFIALALVAGIPAAIIYSLTRIGDRKPSNA